MPNWCINYLDVNGEKDILKKFIEENRNDEDDSLAQRLDNSDKDYDLSKLSFEKSVSIGEWNYDRAVKEWGCKWDASDVELFFDEESETAQYVFSTPWSPPTEWLKKVGKKYKDLIFKLKSEEPGCDFVYFLEIEEGEITKEENYSLESYYWDENGYEEPYKKMIQYMFKENLVKDIIKDIDLDVKNNDNYNSFELDEFMNNFEIEKSEELIELWNEVDGEEINSYIFNHGIENYMNEKIIPLIRFIRKFQKRVQMKKIFKLSHQIKNKNIVDNIEKISYIPPNNNDNESSKEFFVFNKIPKILENGGFHYNELVKEL
jgi:hypothetical protein